MSALTLAHEKKVARQSQELRKQQEEAARKMKNQKEFQRLRQIIEEVLSEFEGVGSFQLRRKDNLFELVLLDQSADDQALVRCNVEWYQYEDPRTSHIIDRAHRDKLSAQAIKYDSQTKNYNGYATTKEELEEDVAEIMQYYV